MIKSLATIEKDIKENPANAELYHELGELFFSRNDYSRAQEAYLEGLKITNWAHDRCFYRYICALNTDDKNRNFALEECNKHTNFAPAVLGKALIAYSRAKTKKDKVAALKLCKQALALDNYFSYSHGLQGIIYASMGQYDEAVESYKTAILLYPMYIDAYRNHAHLYIQREDGDRIDNYNKAIELYKDAIVLDPHNPKIFHNRGEVYFSKALHAKSFSFYKMALEDFQHAESLYENYLGEKEYRKSRIADFVKRAQYMVDFLSRSQKSEDVAFKILSKTTENLSSAMYDNSEKFREFYDHSYKNHSCSDDFNFLVLRRWNSHTPIVGKGFFASKGGGYFVRCGEKGIVIDPGFNFIQNFVEAGFHFKDINYVMITHAHNDHTADLESILTILYRYNREKRGSLDEYREHSDYDKALKVLNISREEVLNNGNKEKLEKELENLEYEPHRITFCVTKGVFKKYSSVFNLYKKSNYEIVCVDSKHFNDHPFAIDKLNIRSMVASHNDLMSDSCSIGFFIRYKKFAVVFTGDTSFREIDQVYADIKKNCKDCEIILIANLGGFKDEELRYDSNSSDTKAKFYYDNHLGRLGVIKLVQILQPKICVLTEFGEEFNGCRVELAKIFEDELKTIFFPADIGLEFNSKMMFRVISKINTKQDKSKEIFERGWVSYNDVECYEVKELSSIFYIKKGINKDAVKEAVISDIKDSLDAI